MHRFKSVQFSRAAGRIGLLTAALAGLIQAGAASAQTAQRPVLGAPPIVGGTGGLAFPDKDDKNRFGTSPNQHKTVTGQPCVDIHGMLRPQIVNPNITEHVLIIANSCSYPISLKACYYQSTTCLKTTIAGYGKRQQTLGFSADKDFRFSYTEDFN
ncbi:hypothetical protein JJB99_29790 [Bradyrhizobium diazoefficiens]|uniref:hypothetical protein n=1 Tax=Bradyrhizobium diazoefficiens TaxID=1355477 RepID=UPI00190A630C|nr:hypothetical protein [Bradyrhizobium diazoefficiens]QQO13553.1 hypothetical protein JJB99_29790 [Bradyrhizobium diazoefficiens]